MSNLDDDYIAIIGRLLAVIQSIEAQADNPEMVRKICRQVLKEPERAAGPAGTEGQVRILERLDGRKD